MPRPERPPASKRAETTEAAPKSPEPDPAPTPPPVARPSRPAPSLPIDDVIDQGPARHRARRGWFGRRKRYRHIAVLLPLVMVAGTFAVSIDQRRAHNGKGNQPFTLSITADRPTGGDAPEDNDAAMPEDVALMGVQDKIAPRNDAVTPVIPGRPIPRSPKAEPKPKPAPDEPVPQPVPTPPGPAPDPVPPRLPTPDPVPEPPLPPAPQPEPEPTEPPLPPKPPAPPEPPNPGPVPLPSAPPVPEPPKNPQPNPPKPPGLPLPLPLPTAIPLPPLPLPLPLPTQLPLPL